MIKATIFDMDGLLIDSEPIWRKAEVQVFNAVGIPLVEDMCMETMGLKVDQVVQYWDERYPRKIQNADVVRKDIMERVVTLVHEEAVAMKGVQHALENIAQKNVKMALASSSDMVLIDTVLDKLDIRSYFNVVYSAEYEPYGKPHPGVYIETAKRLDVLPEHCLAFEDSLNGLLSAKAARMKCISVPDKELTGDPKLAIADVVLDSLEDFNDDIWERLIK